MTGSIGLENLSFAFTTRSGEGLPVLDGIDLTIPGGGIVALIGPNGCGKSTLLRVIAGLLVPGSGTAQLDGSSIDGPDPRIGLVFQEARLLPWRSAADNITYPLELAGWSPERRAERLTTLTDLVDIDPAVTSSRPSELSGGTRQRVALARALALEPAVLLLDEPTSALDAGARDAIERTLRDLAIPLVVVTHDAAQAERLADHRIEL